NKILQKKLHLKLGTKSKTVTGNEVLEQEENTTQKYLDIAGVMFIIINKKGNITLINRRGSEILGYKQEEIIGQNWFDNFLPKNIKEDVKKVFNKLMTGKIEPVEFYNNPILTKNGKIRIIAWHNAILKDKKGKITGTLSSGEDITGYKQAEETAEKERILLRTLIDNLPNGIFVKDKEYRKIIANSLHLSSMAAHLSKIGLDPSIDIIGKTDFEVTLKEWADIYFTDDQKVIRDGISIINKEEEGYGPDGKKIWLLISKIPIRDNDGEINGMVGITTDITKLKLAEEAIIEERSLLRTLIENLPVGIFVKDKDYRKIIVNPIHINEVKGHLKYLGIDHKIDLLGKTDFEVFPKKMAHEFFTEDQKIIRKGKIVHNREGIGYNEKGKQNYLLVSKIPLRDAKNRIIGLVGVTNDITKQKQTEKELIIAKEKAEESDKLKSAFLANMSHEIRTPMNAILGFSRLLANPDLSDEKKKNFIQFIINSGIHLLALINDIIDISKIEANLLSVKKRPCEIHHIMSETIAILKNLPAFKLKKELNLVLNLPKKINECIIETDQEKLIQVFNNLIINAIKHTSKGYVEFGYSIIKENRSKFIQFYVKDTGIGIPDDKKHIIFKRFRQVDEFNYHEGTGLGLSISKGIIEMLGGKIRFDSKYQEGSTFYFTLPYTSKYENIVLIQHQKNTPKLTANWKNKTLVIAEDDVPSMQYIRELLLPTGINIVSVYNGKALLEYLDCLTSNSIGQIDA
ncbi:PAS domain S-box protein, partial [Bacteroidota bacterium]